MQLLCLFQLRRTTGKLHFTFTPVDPNFEPIKDTLGNPNVLAGFYRIASTLSAKLNLKPNQVYLWWTRWVPPPGPVCVYVASTLTVLFISDSFLHVKLLYKVLKLAATITHVKMTIYSVVTLSGRFAPKLDATTT